MAKVDGLAVAGIGSARGGAAPAWNTYVSVESADAIAARVTAAGGTVVVEPFDVGPAGRMAVFADPDGAAFRVWQAGSNHGAQGRQRARRRGTAATSTRATSKPPRPSTARCSVGRSTRWTWQGPNTMVRVPGYGEHLEARNPGKLAARRRSARPRASRTRSPG